MVLPLVYLSYGMSVGAPITGNMNFVKNTLVGADNTLSLTSGSTATQVTPAPTFAPTLAPTFPPTGAPTVAVCGICEAIPVSAAGR
jgi:hypothetical protein